MFACASFLFDERSRPCGRASPEPGLFTSREGNALTFFVELKHGWRPAMCAPLRRRECDALIPINPGIREPAVPLGRLVISPRSAAAVSRA
jgi:hypothetical protein